MSVSTEKSLGMNAEKYLSDKVTINRLWASMVAEARTDVSILAGDVSWIQRDETIIRNQIQQGKKFSVVCRRPLHKELEATQRLRDHVKRLLLAGVDVKYYVEELKQEPKIRGLFVDRFVHSTGLLVRKSPKSRILNTTENSQIKNRQREPLAGIDRAEGIPGNEQDYNYLGIYYTTPDDIDDILILSELFDRIWNDSLFAFVLEKLDLSLTDYAKLLNIVPHYENLTENNIAIERIHSHELWAVSRLVKNYKFDATSALVDAYKTQNIELFHPCIVISSGNPGCSILLPPIVERHDDKLVVIDGMHRLYYGTYYAKSSQFTCLVVSPSLELPGEPIPFDKVVVRSEKPSDRRQIFIDFRANLFRQINMLDNKLIDIAQKRLQISSNPPISDTITAMGSSNAEFVREDNTKTQSKPIRILFLGINPKDTSRLRIDEEIRNIKQTLRQSELRNRFEIEQEWAVRVSDLQGHLLRYEPHIVHISGHGSELNKLILEDNTGKIKPVSTHALRKLFAILKDNIRCVVLNVCYSEEQAKAISEHIDFVIGMSDAIGDEAAIGFSTSFYQALGYGRNIKTAFELGKGLLDLENLDEKDIPRLFRQVNKDSEDMDL